MLAHVEDPAPTRTDLPVLSRRERARRASVVPGIARFLHLYHADVADGALADALVLSTQLLAQLAPHSAPPRGGYRKDPLGDKTVREAARKELAKLPAGPQRGDKR